MNNVKRFNTIITILFHINAISLIHSKQNDTLHPSNNKALISNLTQTNQSEHEDKLHAANNSDQIIISSVDKASYRLSDQDIDQIFYVDYVGEWQDSSRGSSLESILGFDKKTGKIMLNFIGGYKIVEPVIWFNPSTELVRHFTLEIFIFNGYYHDEQHYFLRFGDLVLIQSNNSTQVYQVIGGVNHSTIISNCNFVVTLNFESFLSHIEDENLSKKTVDKYLSVNMTSSKCDIDLVSVLHQDSTNYKIKEVNYMILQVIVELINFQFAFEFIRYLVRRIMANLEINSISEISLAFIAVSEFGLVLLQSRLPFGMFEEYKFILRVEYTIGGLLFMLFILLTLVREWGDENVPQEAEPDIIQSSCSSIGLLCLSVFASVSFVLFPFDNSFWVLMSFNLLPQIIKNSSKPGRVPLDTKLILAVVGLKPFYVLYIRGCPYNIFQTKPSYGFCTVLLFIITSQVATLYYQSKYDSNALRRKLIAIITFSDHQSFEAERREFELHPMNRSQDQEIPLIQDRRST